MTDFLTVGKILKAQGIKGEVKIVPLTDDPQRFKKLKTPVFLMCGRKEKKFIFFMT